MNKHTPGKWTVEPVDMDGSESFFDVKTRTKMIARFIDVEANARLIASVPYLINAFKEIIDQEQHDDNAETHMNDMANIARSAIKMATGEQL